MSLRFSPDRSFVQQSRSALLERIQNLRPRVQTFDRIDPRWQPELARIRQEINSPNFSRDAVIYRTVRLAQQLAGASGAGVWLVADDDIFYCEGSGSASNDERLRIDVFSQLATSCKHYKPNRPAKFAAAPADGAAGEGPIWAKSLIVEPISQGQEISGALAVFSAEPSRFTEQDAASIHALATLLGQALTKAVAMGQERNVALKPEAVLQLIERTVPSLLRMVQMDERYSDADFLRRHSEPSIPTSYQDELERSTESIEESDFIEATGGAWAEQEPGASSASPEQKDEDRSSAGNCEAPRTAAAPATLFLHHWHQQWSHLIALFENRTLHAFALVTQSLPRLSTRVGSVAGESGEVTSSEDPTLPTSVEGSGRTRLLEPLVNAIRVTGSRFQDSFHFAPRVPTLIAAPIAVILAVVITYPIIQGSRPHRDKTTAASALAPSTTSTASSGVVTAGDVEAELRESATTVSTPEVSVEQVGTVVPRQASHLQITDRVTEVMVVALSRYELAGLQRRARFGDDSAALQIGMAYEIGHGVTQSCTTAALWIARAAGAGNAAAQYNLGLRYRDGDGVPVNEDEALKWLREAAGHRSADARIALAALTARQSSSDRTPQP